MEAESDGECNSNGNGYTQWRQADLSTQALTQERSKVILASELRSEVRRARMEEVKEANTGDV